MRPFAGSASVAKPLEGHDVTGIGTQVHGIRLHGLTPIDKSEGEAHVRREVRATLITSPGGA